MATKGFNFLRVALSTSDILLIPLDIVRKLEKYLDELHDREFRLFRQYEENKAHTIALQIKIASLEAENMNLHAQHLKDEKISSEFNHIFDAQNIQMTKMRSDLNKFAHQAVKYECAVATLKVDQLKSFSYEGDSDMSENFDEIENMQRLIENRSIQIAKKESIIERMEIDVKAAYIVLQEAAMQIDTLKDHKFKGSQQKRKLEDDEIDSKRKRLKTKETMYHFRDCEPYFNFNSGRREFQFRKDFRFALKRIPRDGFLYCD